MNVEYSPLYQAYAIQLDKDRRAELLRELLRIDWRGDLGSYVENYPDPKQFNRYPCKGLCTTDLGHAFDWEKSPQGLMYWANFVRVFKGWEVL